MKLHLTFNDHLHEVDVIGLVYMFDPTAQLPNVRVLGSQVAHIQVRKNQWAVFKAAWELAGHTASWGFN